MALVKVSIEILVKKENMEDLEGMCDSFNKLSGDIQLTPERIISDAFATKFDERTPAFVEDYVANLKKGTDQRATAHG